MATKKASKQTKLRRPAVFTPPRIGGTYVVSGESIPRTEDEAARKFWEDHRTGGTKAADRHEKLEEADGADTN